MQIVIILCVCQMLVAGASVAILFNSGTVAAYDAAMGRWRVMRFKQYSLRRRATIGRSNSTGATYLHTLGIVLMVLGGLILLLCVPFKFWLALVGLLLLVFGFFLWRLG